MFLIVHRLAVREAIPAAVRILTLITDIETVMHLNLIHRITPQPEVLILRRQLQVIGRVESTTS